jgi:hypothetical protein
MLHSRKKSYVMLAKWANKWKPLLKAKNHINRRLVELLYIDLFGLIRTRSLSDNRYVFVIVDDFTRYIWVLFLTSKDEIEKRFFHYKHKKWS